MPLQNWSIPAEREKLPAKEDIQHFLEERIREVEEESS